MSLLQKLTGVNARITALTLCFGEESQVKES